MDPDRGYRIRAHVPGDYGQLRALWAGETLPAALGLSAADNREGIAAFLQRNAGLSLGLWCGEELVGSVLAGSDGRRGYIYHLEVRPDVRGRGWGRRLIEQAVAALAASGVQKVHAFVYADNHPGRLFWQSIGFLLRDELVVYSRETTEQARFDKPLSAR
ncbi:MAG: GNAT family N-acetyltransferase [Thermoleophilia bacterium]|nr:GNAT family N-acetyltransferase [Thermoleophilia bacterium]